MTKFATFSETGLPTAFYSEDVHGSRVRPVFARDEDGDILRDEEGNDIIGAFAANPDCLIPHDAVEIADEQWMEFVSNPGRRKWDGVAVIPYDPPSPPLTQADYSAAIQAHLDGKARERQYDNIHTAIGYRDDPNPNFAAEALALFDWRSAVWTFSSAELAKVMVGERQQPTVSEFMGELEAACPFVWPMERAAMLGGQLEL